MPNAKTSKSSSKDAVEKVESKKIDKEEVLSDVISKDEFAEQMKAKDDEIQKLKDMMLQFMSSQNQSGVAQEAPDESIYINNNSVGKVNFVLDSQGKGQYYIEANSIGRPISKEDISLALKVGTMRRLFEYGVLEFQDEKNYKKYGIVKKFDLSEDYVTNLFSEENISSNYSLVEKQLKQSRTLEHELCYKALDLIERGKLSRAEDKPTMIYLNKLFCSNRTANFSGLLSSLKIKRGDWKS